MVFILNKNSLAIKGARPIMIRSKVMQATKTEISRKAKKTKHFIIKAKKTKLFIITEMIFYTWPPLQIVLDITKRWPSDKVNHSCENSL